MRLSDRNRAPSPSAKGAVLENASDGKVSRDGNERAVRDEARRAALRYLQRLKRTQRAHLDDIEPAVVSVIDQVLADPGLIKSFGEMFDQPDYVYEHSVGVCVISVILGIELGFSRCDLHALAVGAILHDVGKAFISDAILNLPRKLTEKEFEEVRKHPALGFEALRKEFNLDIRAAYVAYQHHERVDGTGYPCGLVGEEIHRFARVVSVADVWDAVTSPRPYRDALPLSEAVEIILQGRGTAFDPEVVEALERRLGIGTPRSPQC